MSTQAAAFSTGQVVATLSAMMFHLFLNNLVTLAADLPWYLAGICGVAISSVWNYGVNTTVTWRRTLKSYGRVAEAVLEAGGPIERPEAVA